MIDILMGEDLDYGGWSITIQILQWPHWYKHLCGAWCCHEGTSLKAFHFQCWICWIWFFNFHVFK